MDLRRKKKTTHKHVCAQESVIEKQSPVHTHTPVFKTHPLPRSRRPPPRRRVCRSEKLNFSDEKVPVPLLPFSPPIHSLIYLLIYELLIYSVRGKQLCSQVFGVRRRHPPTGARRRPMEMRDIRR